MNRYIGIGNYFTLRDSAVIIADRKSHADSQKKHRGDMMFIKSIESKEVSSSANPSDDPLSELAEIDSSWFSGHRTNSLITQQKGRLIKALYLFSFSSVFHPSTFSKQYKYNRQQQQQQQWPLTVITTIPLWYAHNTTSEQSDGKLHIIHKSKQPTC